MRYAHARGNNLNSSHTILIKVMYGTTLVIVLDTAVSEKLRRVISY